MRVVSSYVHACVCRNDILLLLELKSACDACEFELQSLKHRRDGLPMAKQASISLPGLPHPSAIKYHSIQMPSFFQSWFRRLLRRYVCLAGAEVIVIMEPCFVMQPLASGLQLIDVVSSASGGGVSLKLCACV